MYGLINEAMRRLVSETAGDDTWVRIATRANAPHGYASLSTYDDAITYDLVGAAALELDTPADQLLRDFGRYWSLHVGPESYADLLGATGTDVVSVVRNLDTMHARLQLLYPELRPPSFAVTDVEATSLVVHYSSERAGLVPFVVGLLEGLGELYGTPATVEYVGEATADSPYETFRVALEVAR